MYLFSFTCIVAFVYFGSQTKIGRTVAECVRECCRERPPTKTVSPELLALFESLQNKPTPHLPSPPTLDSGVVS